MTFSSTTPASDAGDAPDGSAGDGPRDSAGSSGTGSPASAATALDAAVGKSAQTNEQAPTTTSNIFVNSRDKLYRFDVTNGRMDLIAPFQGCSGNILDLALDRDSKLYAIARSSSAHNGALYSVDSASARCAFVTSVYGYPNSLSFLPRGTIDPEQEALVGYFDAWFLRIDPAYDTTMVLSGNLDQRYLPSGDMVSCAGKRTYLTVQGMNCYDCLLEIDPLKGAILKNWGPIGFANVYGLACADSTLYGFTGEGQTLKLALADGSLNSTLVRLERAVIDSFWGAASISDPR